jgi:hypothetical protein
MVSDTNTQVSNTMNQGNPDRQTNRNLNRHGKRADGTALVAVTMPRAIKDQLAAVAEAKGHTLSSFMRWHAQQIINRRRKAARKGAVS